MRKSIYEEALEIIDNNTFELGKGLDVLKPTYRDTIVKALQKAQKQEKLLDLYRKLIPIKDELIAMAYHDAYCHDTEEIKIAEDLEKQIKELEK